MEPRARFPLHRGKRKNTRTSRRAFQIPACGGALKPPRLAQDHLDIGPFRPATHRGEEAASKRHLRRDKNAGLLPEPRHGGEVCDGASLPTPNPIIPSSPMENPDPGFDEIVYSGIGVRILI